MNNFYDELNNSTIAKSLQKNFIGIERESLRVDSNDKIATTRHPPQLGAPVSHPYITTDFAESLIEVVTPKIVGAASVLKFLEDTIHFVYKNLEHNEKLWASSMPCIVRDKSQINIAKYGSSNLAQMKEVYRSGLAARYGKAMQIVAGIHFNYSFSDEFLIHFKRIKKYNKPLRNFKDEIYMHTIRNVLRYGWILYYFFGASNSVCKKFLNNYTHHKLEEFDNNTLYGKYATSLRMSSIGYQNSQEDATGIKANYNSIKQYANSLQCAVTTNCPDYEVLGFKKGNKYLQLNTNILQIENEYYSSVRPKPVAENNIMPSISLLNNGIDYLELRSFDLNPLEPLGINKKQILFTESFLLFCMLERHNPITTKEQVMIDENNMAVAENGLKTQLKIYYNHEKIKLSDAINRIKPRLTTAAQLFGDNHKNATMEIFNNKVLSAVILEDMVAKKLSFSCWADNLSSQHYNYFHNKKIDKTHFELLNELRVKSFEKKALLEKESIDFNVFLANYFKQL